MFNITRDFKQCQSLIMDISEEYSPFSDLKVLVSSMLRIYSLV